MNFEIAFKRGQEGRNVGLTTGIPVLDKAINGIQQKQIIGIAAPPKVGKSKLVDFAFIIMPYLIDVLQKGIDVEWKYYSFEMDRISKEFNFATFFMAYDHSVTEFQHKGITYPLTSEYLQGKVKDQDDERIPVSPAHEEYLKQIYRNRIIPLFGRYNSEGVKIQSGLVDFIEEKQNPTGIHKYLWSYAERNGVFVREEIPYFDDQGDRRVSSRVIGYKANNPDKRVIIITDTMRKLKLERGFSMKQNVDKMIEYQVDLRNFCHYIFVDIIHLNRDLTDTQRIKLNPEYLYPTGDDVKDTGNLSEEANLMFTMFNPNDPKYNIHKHFGLDLHDSSGGLKYPRFKSLHLVDAREVEAPAHIRLDMEGNLGRFSELQTQQDNSGYGY